MNHLFEKDGKPTKLGKRCICSAALAYSVLIVLLCFLPQSIYPQYKSFSTPGIVQIGRLHILPVPFNSLINAHQVDSLGDYLWILLQNMTNVGLLYPLVFCFLFLFEKWQSLRTATLYSFYLSLFIEMTQLLLDLLIDAGRVFEVDDLWTNTLGGVLAYLTYRMFLTHYLLKQDESLRIEP